MSADRRNKIEENKMREKTARELDERYDKAMKAMEKQVEDAQAQYKESMDSLPNGWEMIGMDIVEGLGQVVTNMGNAIVSTCSKLTTLGDCSEIVDIFLELPINTKASQILQQATTLQEFMNGDEINWKDLYDQRNKSAKSKLNEKQFKRISKEIENEENSKAKDEALSLCKSGFAICEQIAMYSPDKKWDKKTTKKLIEDVKKLYEDAHKFDSKSKKDSGISAFAPKPPLMSKTEENSGHQRASQRAAENARFKIEQSREQLKQSREQYNKAVERMERNQKELTDILVEMQNCNIKEIEFDTTIKMLVKGMDAMGRVKEQWEKMVRFFQMVANIVKTSLSKTMKHFAQSAKDAQTLSYNSRLFTKDLMYNQAFQASNIASLVHMISGTYCEVSSKYLMDRVSSLGKLMALDKDKPEFLQERLKLQDSCKEAQENILKLVIQNKKDFEKNTDTRMAQIEGGLKAVLPAADPEETKRIQEIVQGAMTKEDLDLYT
ncbi:uncharacterized protein LOC112154375 [Oryzias melastigma]|uniref:uncharacterized protein LOC112154375 n=1 Tax=Oryzias melastigma TaxID=30732 RepID=UPI00168D7748|nr:uncharacterized protein LOC112154375 [Oryzias melastigma]